MNRLAFSKASLHKQGAQLKRYQQYLPSLDLKRKKLIAEWSHARAQLAKTEELISRCYLLVEEQLPMLSDEHINLTGLVNITQIVISKENIVGITLPFVQQLEIQSNPYSFLTNPHWVDQVIVQLKTMLELKIHLKINQTRVNCLQQAVKKVSQRVNLFDKVLIPRAQNDIGKIKIFLSDAERAAVVRAKITKKKRLKAGR